MLLNDQSCVIYEDKAYGANDLKKIINPICHGLEAYDRDNLRVGIMVESRLEQLCCILAVLNLNGTYIPISPYEPLERIKMVAEQCCSVLISDKDIDITIPVLKYNMFNNFSEDYLNRNLQFMPQYIIYTSSTSGIPKAVEVSYTALLNFIEGISERIDFSAGKRIACLTTFSFDIYFLESIMALYKGLIVVLANEEEQRNPKLIAKLIQYGTVDMIQMTPSRMQLLLNYDKELKCLKNVKDILIGGEPFPSNLLKILRERTAAKIYNMYGPTETTIWSTISELTLKERIDIGLPIKNTEIYIIDENQQILPNEQIGEICITGSGLANGYFGRPDLTEKQYIYLPQPHNVKAYRTGDIGLFLSDGNLQYLGRADNQVKLCGYRIEPEEIESHLYKLGRIKQVIVTVIETEQKEKVLSVLYTSEEDIDKSVFVDFLSNRLPLYMIPVYYKRVEVFNQTKNGKIDRKKVLECVDYISNIEGSNSFNSSLLSDIRKRAFQIIISAIDKKICTDVNLDTVLDNIIDSITFVKIVAALEEEFQIEFDDEKLLLSAFMSINSMIEYVDEKVNILTTPLIRK